MAKRTIYKITSPLLPIDRPTRWLFARTIKRGPMDYEGSVGCVNFDRQSIAINAVTAAKAGHFRSRSAAMRAAQYELSKLLADYHPDFIEVTKANT